MYSHTHEFVFMLKKPSEVLKNVKQSQSKALWGRGNKFVNGYISAHGHLGAVSGIIKVSGLQNESVAHLGSQTCLVLL